MSTSSGDIDTAILEAARESVLELGIDRTTMSGVARRAGISRPTLYARYRGLGVLTSKLLTQELMDVVSTLNPAPETVEDLVEALVAAAENAAGNDLLNSVLKSDPTFVYNNLFREPGEAQIRVIALLEKIIQRIQTSDEVRLGLGGRFRRDDEDIKCISARDPHVLAAFCFGAAQHAAITAAMLQDILGDRSTWQNELRVCLCGYLTCPCAEDLLE